MLESFNRSRSKPLKPFSAISKARLPVLLIPSEDTYECGRAGVVFLDSYHPFLHIHPEVFLIYFATWAGTGQELSTPNRTFHQFTLLGKTVVGSIGRQGLLQKDAMEDWR